jgi:hypothetical protein
VALRFRTVVTVEASFSKYEKYITTGSVLGSNEVYMRRIMRTFGFCLAHAHAFGELRSRSIYEPNVVTGQQVWNCTLQKMQMTAPALPHHRL